MIEIKLSSEEWNRVLAILSQAPWAQVNSLILAIGEQLRTQSRPNGQFEPQEPPAQRQ